MLQATLIGDGIEYLFPPAEQNSSSAKGKRHSQLLDGSLDNGDNREYFLWYFVSLNTRTPLQHASTQYFSRNLTRAFYG